MFAAAMNHASMKTLKITTVALSLLAVTSTLYFFESTEDSVASRMLGASRAARRQAYLDQPRRDLYWVMSYPRGGADEIINFVERTTFKSMGTNYGNHVQMRDMSQHVNTEKSVLLQKRWYGSGPYKNNMEFDLPEDYGPVLVKTYCTSYCDAQKDGDLCEKHPYTSHLSNAQSFWRTCAGGSSYYPGRAGYQVKRSRPYWREEIKKVIVVVRNPMEIVFARWRDHMRLNDEKVSETNFRAYCPMMDGLNRRQRAIRKAFKVADVAAALDGVMCATEFWRITRWYQLALELAESRHPLIIRREDYVRRSDATATAVLKFMMMRRTSKSAVPNVNEGARLYYTDDEKSAIGNFIETAFGSKSDVWDLFKSYFD